LTVYQNIDSTHPSYLELDRFALGAPGYEGTHGHVQGCARCRDHVARVSVPSAVPQWVRALPEKRARPKHLWVAGLSFGVGGLAAAAALALMVTTRNPAGTTVGPVVNAPYVGTKGGPEVWVYVKRGEDVVLWQPGSPLQPGDRLRLQVDSGGLPQVAVFELDGPNGYRSLWSGTVATSGPSTLPVAWSVDARPGDERLVVVASRASLSVSEVAARLRQPADGKDGWTRQLLFPKAAPDGSVP
jgi:hypothetical protein